MAKRNLPEFMFGAARSGDGGAPHLQASEP